MLESLIHVSLTGISAGMFIWLVASGLTLIFGVLRVLNFAHGSFYMLGAYLCYTVLRYIGVDFWLGVIVGPLVVCVVGFLMERFLLRQVYDLELPYQLLLTFAMVLIFDELVKMIWGAGSIGSPTVPGLSGSIQIAGRNFPVYNLFIMVVGPLVAIGLWAFLEKSWWGRLIRAAAADREMAAAIGVRVPALYTAVFVFGAWLSAVGGALAVPYVGLLTTGMGEAVIINAFVVVVIGGLGSLQGAFLGALFIGLLNSFGTRYVPALDMFLTFILMGVVLLWRPQGFFAGVDR
ncbi:branched-chain amino acid ABC transporter permease [Desulfomonile tiedjei]|uniref:Amino acid/amide ABC transporter membrane protein 1, HAAT family n=1 Tax=Desulfomonile tiedjei (strain ATCC 49306 / DSM 6799 / DCB-1) TaxID=706587 RepID=I4C557_DESTA|nr:branched-chain amino acid ABC transporter permease [Desulfomonile tiedjei]AFM24698.1 amino acid/amide ABC transporter membrane protein 1, HAAT family [Desulfomonile tiedjei DSM 6799]